MPRTASCALVALLLFASATSSRAAITPLDQFRAALEPVKKERAWGDSLLGLLNDVAAARRLTGTLEFGYSSQKAGARNLRDIAATANLERGTYPRRVNFNSGAAVQFRDDVLQEEVRGLLLAYEYHFHPNVETYGFVERFTNSYMGIDQRYELGAGLKYEWETGGLLPRATNWSAALRRIQRDPDEAKWVREAIAKKYPADAGRILDAVRTDPYLKPLIRKRHARVSLGFAVSAFNEIEDPFVESFVDSLAADTSNIRASSASAIKVALASQEHFRVALRPSVTLRFTDELSTTAMVYFKLPAEEPFEIDDHFDYRVESLLRATLKLAESADGDETVSITWETRDHFDNTPPRIPESRIATERAAFRRYRDPLAPRRHRSGVFKLSVKW